MDPWEVAAKASESSGSNASYIRLKAGEFVECVFRGAPYTFYQKFKDVNEYSEPGEGRSLKFRINVIVKEGNVYVAKLFQQGGTVLKDLIAARNEYGLDCIFKIKREGSTKDDTKYHILFKSNLTDDQKKLFATIDLLELKSGRSRKDAPVKNEMDQRVEGDVPF